MSSSPLPTGREVVTIGTSVWPPGGPICHIATMFPDDEFNVSVCI